MLAGRAGLRTDVLDVTATPPAGRPAGTRPVDRQAVREAVAAVSAGGVVRERPCRRGHYVGQHEIRAGVLFGCYITGCPCLDFTDAQKGDP